MCSPSHPPRVTAGVFFFARMRNVHTTHDGNNIDFRAKYTTKPCKFALMLYVVLHFRQRPWWFSEPTRGSIRIPERIITVTLWTRLTMHAHSFSLGNQPLIPLYHIPLNTSSRFRTAAPCSYRSQIPRSSKTQDARPLWLRQATQLPSCSSGSSTTAALAFGS